MRFSSGLGVDLSGVRLHTGEQSMRAAKAVAARAYTTGQDIHFAAGEYNPQSPQGKRLLAHELVHTVQQSEHRATQTKLDLSQTGDASEVEAERVSDAIISGEPVQALTASLHHSQPKIARQPEGAQKPAEVKPAATAAGGAAVPLGDLLPFTDAGWDGATILTVGQIDPASAVGNAVTAGPQAVNTLNESLYSQLLAELDTLKEGDRYINAVTEAASVSAIFSSSLKTHLASYGELRQISRVSAALTATGKDRRRSLLAWAFQPAPARGLVGTQPPEPIGVRENVVAQLDKWAETTEGVTKVAKGRPKFSEFRSAQSLEATRKSYAKGPKTTFTTCIEFLGWALANGIADAHARLKVSDSLINANLWYPEKRASLPEKAWTDYKPGMEDRPQPGDIYMLVFAEDVYKPGKPKTAENIKNVKASFSHIGFIRSIRKNPVKEGEEPTETWEGVDGGAGTATIFHYEGRGPKSAEDPTEEDKFTTTQQGAEKIETAVRLFYPKKNIFPAGVKNQDQGPRHLLGWLNIDKLV